MWVAFANHIFFFSKSIGVYAIFDDQSFNDMLTNDIVCFEQLGPDLYKTAGLEPNTTVYTTLLEFHSLH